MRETASNISNEAFINMSFLDMYGRTYVSSPCPWDASESTLTWGVPAISSPSPSSSIIACLCNVFNVNVKFYLFIPEPFPFPCG